VAIVWLAIFVNTSVKSARKVLNLLFFVKIAALLVISVGGVYWMGLHGAGHLKQGFTGEFIKL